MILRKLITTPLTRMYFDLEYQMKVFNRRNVLKGGLVGSMAAGFASFMGASHAAEPAANAPAQNDKNTYDVIVLGAGPAGLVTAIAAKQAGAKKVVVFEKRDRPDGNAIFALGSVCGWGSRHQKEQGIKDTADDFYAMMMDVSKQMGDKALNRTYTDNISAGIDWLEKDIGVKFVKIRPMPYPRLGRTCRVDGEGLTGGAQHENLAGTVFDLAVDEGLKAVEIDLVVGGKGSGHGHKGAFQLNHEIFLL